MVDGLPDGQICEKVITYILLQTCNGETWDGETHLKGVGGSGPKFLKTSFRVNGLPKRLTQWANFLVGF